MCFMEGEKYILKNVLKKKKRELRAELRVARLFLRPDLHAVTTLLFGSDTNVCAGFLVFFFFQLPSTLYIICC